MATDPILSTEEAEKLAKRMTLDGYGLYVMSKWIYQEELGDQGVVLYEHLSSSRYRLICVIIPYRQARSKLTFLELAPSTPSARTVGCRPILSLQLG